VNHNRLSAEPAEKLLNKPRLPDPSETENGKELTRSAVERLLEGIVQAASLTLPSDHRRVESTALCRKRVGDV
jgi:hypothetical protein